MNATNGDIVTGIIVAASTAIFIALTLWFSRMIGRWLMKAVTQTFAATVSDVVAPDLARFGHRLGTSVDELREQNSLEHTADQIRLTGVETRLTGVEVRLVAVESRLGIRPLEARTRITDTKGETE